MRINTLLTEVIHPMDLITQETSLQRGHTANTTNLHHMLRRQAPIHNIHTRKAPLAVVIEAALGEETPSTKSGELGTVVIALRAQATMGVYMVVVYTEEVFTEAVFTKAVFMEVAAMLVLLQPQTMGTQEYNKPMDILTSKQRMMKILLDRLRIFRSRITPNRDMVKTIHNRNKTSHK